MGVRGTAPDWLNGIPCFFHLATDLAEIAFKETVEPVCAFGEAQLVDRLQQNLREIVMRCCLSLEVTEVRSWPSLASVLAHARCLHQLPKPLREDGTFP